MSGSTDLEHPAYGLFPKQIEVDRIADPDLSDEEYAKLEQFTLKWENENRRVMSHLYYSALHLFDLITLGLRYRR